MFLNHADINSLLYLLTTHAKVKVRSKFRFVIRQLYRDVSTQFPIFSYAIVTTGAYRDGSTRVCFI